MNLYLFLTQLLEENYPTSDGIYIINAENRVEAEEQLKLVKPITETVVMCQLLISRHNYSEVLFKQKATCE